MKNKGREERIMTVVAWHDRGQIQSFLYAWRLAEINPWVQPPDAPLPPVPDWLVLQQDVGREGCAVTKNKGIAEARRRGAEIVVVLDDDCYPVNDQSLPEFMERHRVALQPQEIQGVVAVTDPPSRGMPYHELTYEVPIAASMGFWEGIGDYDAPGQLVHGAETPMKFRETVITRACFPLSGMNLAFRPADWWPWCQFIEVPRFDDIWMGWLWQKEAYRRGCGFNLNGPRVRHARQSNVWRNLQQEAVHLERNETLWRDIRLSQETGYEELRKLLPVGAGEGRRENEE